MRRERVLIPDELYDTFEVEGSKSGALDALWAECVAERLDNDFVGRTHGSIGTYNAGCQGPICRAGRRAYARKEGTQAHKSMIVMDQIIKFYVDRIDWIAEQNKAVSDTLLYFGQVSPHYHELQDRIDAAEVNALPQKAV